GGGGCCHEEGLVALDGSSALSVQTEGGATTTEPSFLNNTLLANVPPGITSTDCLQLEYGPKWTVSGARLQLDPAGGAGTWESRVRLLAVSQTPGEELFAAGEQVMSGKLARPDLVKIANGRDLTALFAADSSFEGRDGDTLLVEFADRTPGRIALTSSRSQ